MQRLFNSRHPRSQASSTLSSNSNSEYSLSNKLKKPEQDRNGDNNFDGRRKNHSESSRSVGQLASRTLTLASTSLGSSSSNDTLALVPRSPQPISNANANVGAQPLVYYRARTQPNPLSTGGGPASITPREMYWASRAIHSETLLAATTHHHHEVKELIRSRADEILLIKQEHDSRKARLEWLLILLATTMILLSAYAIHLSIYPRHKPRGWINFTFPHHFTIPLLSPFASVVETESSVFNNRIIMLGLIITGAVAYGLIRHRMNMKQGHGMPKTK